MEDGEVPKKVAEALPLKTRRENRFMLRKDGFTKYLLVRKFGRYEWLKLIQVV